MTKPTRPRMLAQRAPVHPAVDEAVTLYERTASLPLLPWEPDVPLELRNYLDLIYAGAPDGPRTPVPLDQTVIHQPAQPWPQDTMFRWPVPLVPSDRVWVAFTGGKDSVAAALHVQAQGRTPVLWHLAGINRGMGDEPRYAQRVADRMGWPLVVDRVSVSGPKAGVMELPTKNQVTALFLAARMCEESDGPLAAADYVTGWHASDTQDKQAFGYDYSDGAEAIAAFGAYLSARLPGLRYEQVLHDTTQAWALIADAGLLQYIKGCVCPLRYKARVRAANVKKFGWLLAGRCGSCVKCGWEEWALQAIGALPYDKARLDHGLKWMVRDFGERFPGLSGRELEQAVIDFLVPPDATARYARSGGDWPDQPAPVDEADGTPVRWQPAQV